MQDCKWIEWPQQFPGQFKNELTNYFAESDNPGIPNGSSARYYIPLQEEQDHSELDKWFISQGAREDDYVFIYFNW